MEKPELLTAGNFSPIPEQEYERYLPSAYNEALSIIQKVNIAIKNMNDLGVISNTMLDKWNEVVEWITNDGLTDNVIDKINSMVSDGTMDDIINDNVFGAIKDDLMNKATKTEVNDIGISQINKNKGLIDQTYLSSTLLQQIAGTTPINSVPADRSITTLKIAENAVSPTELSKDLLKRTMTANSVNQKLRSKVLFEDAQVNLFNKDNVITGYYIINGVPSVSAGNVYSDYIEIKPSTTYWFTRLLTSDAGSLYDDNMKFISKFVGDGTNLYTFPSNAYYVRVNISPASSPLANYMMVEGSVAPALYQDHGVGKIKGLKVSSDHVDGVLHPEQLADVDLLNMYDLSSATLSTYVSNVGVVASSGIIDLSRFIKVNGGEVIGANFKYDIQGAYYSIEKTWLKQITLTETSAGSGWFTETVPSGVAFIRLNVVKNDASLFMAKKSSSKPVTYSPYQGNLKWLNVANSNYLYGKQVACFGDSITWLDGTTDATRNYGQKVVGYQEQFRKVGALVSSFGNSGATIRQYDAAISDMTHGSIYDDIVTANKDVTSYDVITLFAGTNDVGRGLNLGNVGLESDSSFDPKTTLGALRGIIEYILSHNPSCDIYIMTPIRSGLSSRPYDKMEQITTGMKSVSEIYSIPAIDLLHTSGISKGNYTTFLYDDLHPNNKGFERIGRKMVKQINSK